MERISTGIPGLDVILEGGFLKGGVYMVNGPPGAGKTTLGNQICFHHAATGGQAVYVTLLAESHSRMLMHMRRMEFFDPTLIPERVYYISALKPLEEGGLASMLKLLRHAITTRNASLLVVDGLVTAQETSSNGMELKRFIQDLQSLLDMVECTTILLGSGGTRDAFEAAHTMVDGILELTDKLEQLRSMRHIHVRKLRGTKRIGGMHTLEISDQGVTIHPRFETWLEIQEHVATNGTKAECDRAEFGIQRLDEMLDGGLPRNSTTMILGPSGSGKTALGLHFLAEGARKGEPGILFGFYERPEALLRKAQLLGLELEAVYRDGLVELIHQSSIEGVLDAIGARLISAVRRSNARRLCIDSGNALHQASEYPERIRAVLSALVEELEKLQITTIYNMEVSHLLGTQLDISFSGLSSVTHNIILLRKAERRARLHRLISILKLRDSNHDSATREFHITSRGLVVADTCKSAEQLLSGVAVDPVAPSVSEPTSASGTDKESARQGQKPQR